MITVAFHIGANNQTNQEHNNCSYYNQNIFCYFFHLHDFEFMVTLAKLQFILLLAIAVLNL